ATGIGTGHALRGLDARRLPTQPSHLRPRATLPSASLAFSGRRWGALTLIAVIAALVAGGYALWKVRRNSLSPRAQATEPNVIPAPSDAPVTCLGTLLITEVPMRSEVLVHEGQAPVDVTRMPVGARLEFVATAE